MLHLSRISKEYKILTENEIQMPKFQVLLVFELKILQRVRFWMNFFTTRQILMQKFHNASDFELKVLRRVIF